MTLSFSMLVCANILRESVINVKACIRQHTYHPYWNSHSNLMFQCSTCFNQIRGAIYSWKWFSDFWCNSHYLFCLWKKFLANMSRWLSKIETFIQNTVSDICVCMLSCVWLFAIPWTIARQASLTLGFTRQEFWRGLPFPSPGDRPDPGIELRSPAS